MAQGRRILVIGTVLVALQLGLRAWALSGSWFYFDDLAFMSRAMTQPMDAHYLFESYGGHLMPGGFALIWLLTGWAAYQWWVWAAVLLVMQAAAGLGMLRLLRSMFGDTSVVLLLLAGYLGFVFTLSAGIWFAAGINQLPLQIALVYGLHAHLQYLRTQRWQHLATAMAWTLFGLLFYEKTLLLFGVYGLVALCWFSTGNTPERLTRLWGRYRWGIVTQGVVAVAYAALYVAFGLNFSPSTAGTQPLTPVAWNLVAVAGATGAVGGPLEWRPLDVGSFAQPSDFVQLVSWLVIGTLVLHAIRTREVSKRAWSLVAFTLLSNVILLGSARATIVGPDIALEYRYQTETAALFVLSAGLAFLPLRGAWCATRCGRGCRAPTRPVRSSSEPPSPSWWRHWSRPPGTSTSGSRATRLTPTTTRCGTPWPGPGVPGATPCRSSTEASPRRCSGPTVIRRTPSATSSATCRSRRPIRRR